MIRCAFVLLFYWVLLACSDGVEDTRNNQHPSNPLEVEKKYYLKDCIVKVALLWHNNESWEDKYEVVDSIQKQMRFAVVSAISGNFPLFVDSYTREASFVVIYYSDRCEDRVSMTDRLIQDYLLPEVENFPEFSIETDVAPGFDGSLPSGWWLDD